MTSGKGSHTRNLQAGPTLFKKIFVVLLLFIPNWIEQETTLLRAPEVSHQKSSQKLDPDRTQGRKPKVKRVLSSSKRKAKFSAGYYFQRIEQNLNRDRLKIAKCFLIHEHLTTLRFDLSLQWSGAGQLQLLKLTPNKSDAIGECLKQVVDSWELELHPGMQPFVYETQLVLG